MKSLGVAVVVNGEIVAWFRSFTGEAQEWCTREHLAQWCGFYSPPPPIKPLSKKQQRKRAKSTARLQKKLQKCYPEDTITVNTHHGYALHTPDSKAQHET